MKSKQQAEREEQQRIKSLVLNYDLGDGEDQDGDDLSLTPLVPNYNIKTVDAGLERLNVVSNSKVDKSVNNRSGHRARKLQLSDVDWYGKTSPNPSQKQTDSRKESEGPAILSAREETVPSTSTAPLRDRPVYAPKDAPTSRPAANARKAPAQRGRGGSGIRGRGRGSGRGQPQPMWRPDLMAENRKIANDAPM